MFSILLYVFLIVLLLPISIICVIMLGSEYEMYKLTKEKRILTQMLVDEKSLF